MFWERLTKTAIFFMITDLEVLKLYSAMTRHAAESQRVSAENVSRYGEAGYKAQEVESFQDYLTRVGQSGSPDALKASFKTMDAGTPAAPNGNTVSLEHEIFKSAEAFGQHNMALTVYSKSLDLLRTAIGRGR
jgi:flagellar basal-body rod protein FlgB